MPTEHSPGRRLISAKQVCDRMNWSRPTLWRRIRAGKFCAPVENGRNSIAFWDDEVATEQAKLPRVSYAPEPEAT